MLRGASGFFRAAFCAPVTHVLFTERVLPRSRGSTKAVDDGHKKVTMKQNGMTAALGSARTTQPILFFSFFTSHVCVCVRQKDHFSQKQNEVGELNGTCLRCPHQPIRTCLAHICRRTYGLRSKAIEFFFFWGRGGVDKEDRIIE